MGPDCKTIPLIIGCWNDIRHSFELMPSYSDDVFQSDFEPITSYGELRFESGGLIPADSYEEAT